MILFQPINQVLCFELRAHSWFLSIHRPAHISIRGNSEYLKQFLAWIENGESNQVYAMMSTLPVVAMRSFPWWGPHNGGWGEGGYMLIWSFNLFLFYALLPINKTTVFPRMFWAQVPLIPKTFAFFTWSPKRYVIVLYICLLAIPTI